VKLQNVRIVNFRGLAEIEFKADRDVCVIVGPNAVGKTSVLQAIRLAKSILAQRFSNEAEIVVRDMSAMIGGTNALNFSSLAGDPTKQIEIDLSFELSSSEVQIIQQQAANLALVHTRNQVALPPAVDEFAFVQFLSSPHGKGMHEKSLSTIQEKISQLERVPRIRLTLAADSQPGSIRGGDLFSQEVVTVLERHFPPAEALFSYFPADRAMPTGEVGIQIGIADAQAQIQSHMAQPGTKYQRLKNFLVNQSLMGPDARTALQEDFALIFKTLLPGKALKDLSISPHGLLSVLIEDTDTRKVYDIDNMSSGEKGLLLQFLLMRRAVSNGGILLVDEPELHLNQAVCRRLLPFIAEYVLKPRSLTAIICTHSPEILGDAFDRNDCRLFHLRSARDISPIERTDKAEMFEALRRLGAQTGDVLFSKGTIFVEGAYDSDLLALGFGEQLSGFRVTQLRGRSEVEKEIKKLQALEREGKLDGAHYFIFDRDRKHASIENTKLVRILQWDRYCFENYLLEPDAIYDVCNNAGVGVVESRGSIRSTMKRLAFQQVTSLAVREVYKAVEPENAGLRSEDLAQGASYDEIAALLFQRLEVIRKQIEPLEKTSWTKSLSMKCQQKEKEINSVWEEKWASECDGKRLFVELHRECKVSISLLEFKKRVISAMHHKEVENWRVVQSCLIDLLR
jgi:predicted ATPase